jgi:hypothetical protein
VPRGATVLQAPPPPSAPSVQEPWLGPLQLPEGRLIGCCRGGAVPADTRETRDPSDGHRCLGHSCLLLDVRRQPNECKHESSLGGRPSKLGRKLLTGGRWKAGGLPRKTIAAGISRGPPRASRGVLDPLQSHYEPPRGPDSKRREDCAPMPQPCQRSSRPSLPKPPAGVVTVHVAP